MQRDDELKKSESQNDFSYKYKPTSSKKTIDTGDRKYMQHFKHHENYTDHTKRKEKEIIGRLKYPDVEEDRGLKIPPSNKNIYERIKTNNGANRNIGLFPKFQEKKPPFHPELYRSAPCTLRTRCNLCDFSAVGLQRLVDGIKFGKVQQDNALFV